MGCLGGRPIPVFLPAGKEDAAMLFLLIGVLLLASLAILCLKKSKESVFLLGMCVSLMLQFSGILLFIAKKGGFTQDVLRFLFFSTAIKTRVQYLFVTLDTMGYLIALGRYLFPLFLLEFALCYTVLPWLRRRPWIQGAVTVLPAVSLLLYFPAVYRSIMERWPFMQDVLVQCSYYWILGYVALAILLLVVEYFSIAMRFYRRQFSLIVVCMAALSGLYLLYCGQDPGQVYRFYSYGYLWNKGLGYMQYAPSVGGYYTIVIVNVICGVLGFSSLLRYTQGSFESSRDDILMERKFAAARSGVSVFVHGMKNQLLANRVLFKRIWQEADVAPGVSPQLRAHLDSLQTNNEQLITRMEELYKTVKSQSIRLSPLPLDQLFQTVEARFRIKYPEGGICFSTYPEITVLVDEPLFAEALYNLCINGWEATLAAGRSDPVQVLCCNERMYTVIEVRDSGTGIAPEDHKKIFEPFFTSKNANYNWGMGLYYVRTIVKGHLGSLRLESQPGKGASFYITLPKYSRGGKL